MEKAYNCTQFSLRENTVFFKAWIKSYHLLLPHLPASHGRSARAVSACGLNQSRVLILDVSCKYHEHKLQIKQRQQEKPMNICMRDRLEIRQC